MSHTTSAMIQQWLESTKLTITQIDPELEKSIWSMVWGQLAGSFGRDLANTWTNETNTPLLVQQIVSLMYASMFYRKEYAEVAASETNASYDQHLATLAADLLDGIMTGALEMPEVTVDSVGEHPAFWPNDKADNDCGVVSDQLYGPHYAPWYHDGGNGVKFQMGKVF
jgi:hypothetical protein